MTSFQIKIFLKQFLIINENIPNTPYTRNENRANIPNLAFTFFRGAVTHRVNGFNIDLIERKENKNAKHATKIRPVSNRDN